MCFRVFLTWYIAPSTQTRPQPSLPIIRSSEVNVTYLDTDGTGIQKYWHTQPSTLTSLHIVFYSPLHTNTPSHTLPTYPFPTLTISWVSLLFREFFSCIIIMHITEGTFWSFSSDVTSSGPNQLKLYMNVPRANGPKVGERQPRDYFLGGMEVCPPDIIEKMEAVCAFWHTWGHTRQKYIYHTIWCILAIYISAWLLSMPAGYLVYHHYKPTYHFSSALRLIKGSAGYWCLSLGGVWHCNAVLSDVTCQPEGKLTQIRG